MSVLATSLAGELENGDDREQRPSSILPSPPKKQKISEKNKVIAASTGAVVTSLTMTPFDVVKTRLQTQGPSSQPPQPSQRSTSPWPRPVPSTSSHHPLPSHPPISTSSATSQKTFFSPNLEPPPSATSSLLARFDPRIASSTLPSSGSHLHPSPAQIHHLAIHPTALLSTTCLHPIHPSTTHPPHLKGFWDAVFKIVGNEGLAALWRGTAPALAMSVPGQVVYMVGYDWGRRTAFAHAPAWAYVESDSVNPLKDAAHLSSSYTTAVSLIGGSFSRTVVAALVSPVELLRTRLQSSSSSIDIITLARTLHAEGGWISAYRGLPPTLWRDVPFSGIYWAGYEAIKRAMTGGKGMGEATEGQGISGEFGVAFVSGAGSGMIAATATNPFDVVKTRRQALSLPSSSSTPPSSSPSTQEAAAAETRTFKIIADIVRKEGWPALMKGLTPRLAKVGPACGIMVGCYEGLGKWLD
ncbi:mitochondrial carrier protein, family 25 member 40 [Pseudohyphozyma bogoriensis]|nr:mitochondrial carrier protein, family 25 member 40 [Pseudohyphozyma bogoriensis]